MATDGKAVKAVDKQSKVELAARWSAEEISRTIIAFLWLSALLFVLIGGGVIIRKLTESIVLNIGGTGFLAMAVDMLAGIGEPLLLSMIWPVLLCLVLLWLKWPQLVKPAAWTLGAYAVAPLLGRLIGSLLVGTRPRDWYSQLQVLTEWGVHLLFAFWIFTVAQRLWEIDRRSSVIFRQKKKAAPVRKHLSHAALATAAVYGIAIVIGTAWSTQQRIDDGSSAQQGGVLAKQMDERFKDFTRLQVIDMLDSRNPDDRYEAVNRLREMEVARLRKYATKKTTGVPFDLRGVKALTGCLSDEDIRVRNAACLALGQIGKPAVSAVEPLAQRMADTNETVRKSAFTAFRSVIKKSTRQELPVAVPHLIRALPHMDHEMVRAVLSVLDSIQWNWHERKEVRAVAKTLSRRLESKDTETRLAAAVVLSRIGPSASFVVDRMVNLLVDPDPRIRETVDRGLTAIDRDWTRNKTGRKAADLMVAHLTDKDAGIRVFSVSVLLKLQTNWQRSARVRKAVPTLVQSLATLDVSDSEHNLDTLIRFLDRIDPDWRKSKVAVEVVQPLIERLSETPQERKVALQALESLGPTAQPAIGPIVLLMADDQLWNQNGMVRTLESIDTNWPKDAAAQKSLDKLIGQLSDDDANRRVAAANAVQRFGKEAGRAVDKLAVALADSDARVRNAAASALGSIGPAAVKIELQIIRSLFESTTAAGQSPITSVLGQINPLWREGAAAKKAIPFAIQRLQNDDPKVRRGTLVALEQFRSAGRDAFPAIVRCKFDRDADVRSAASRTLRWITTRQWSQMPEVRQLTPVITVLERIDKNWRKSRAAKKVAKTFVKQLQSNDPQKQRAALNAIAVLGPAAADSIAGVATGLLSSKMRFQTRSVLNRIDKKWQESGEGKKALSEFTRSLSDKDAERRAAAAAAMAEFGPHAISAIKPLMEKLSDQDAKVRYAATRTLGRIDPKWQESDPGKKALSEFIRSLSDKDAKSRAAAAGAVGEFGRHAVSAVKPLIGKLDDQDVSVRYASARALGMIGPAAVEAVDALEAQLQVPHVGQAASDALFRIRADRRRR